MLLFNILRGISTASCILLACSGLPAQEKTNSDYVNVFIGTNGMGHTFPGATVPFGSVQLSPDTDTIPHNIAGKYQTHAYDYCAGYRYSDPTITGFSHTHLSGTGHSDLGDILLMPATGEVKLWAGSADDPDKGYRSRFRHETEKACPGYYEVFLDDYGIKAQLTATQRTGVHKYTFPSGTNGHVVLDLVHGIYNYDGKVLWANVRVENDTLLTGYRITNGWARTNYTYFAISFSSPVTQYGFEEKEPPLYRGFWRKFKMDRNFPEMTGRKITAWFAFDTKRNPELTVKVALSSTSTEGALKNLRAESSGRSFEEIAAAARGKWEKELSIFSVEGTEDQKTMFYTSLYHTMINPSVYMDVDRSYRGLDHNVHKAADFTNYTIFSLWDTYRAEHPLLNLIAPERNADMVRSMVAHQQQSVHGMLPVWSLMGNEGWCMSGYHAVSVLADAIVKGVYKDSDGSALRAMVRTSNVPYFDGTEDYTKLGYVPFENSTTAVSTTLEYSYDDWAVSQAAAAEGDSETAAAYRKRALNYRNVFDPKTGFARPKYTDGSFKEDFDPLQTYGEGFIEGNSWNFSFHAPQDVNGLISLMGGDKEFISRLDRLFSMDLPEIYYKDNEDITKECLLGGYVHGNEPSHHVPYLYAWTSQPWKTQYWMREILDRMYRNDMNGLSGNDDCGQMSAWYIFSSMGFYPVAPGCDQYVIGAPYLPYVRLSLPNGNVLEIKAPGVSGKNRYIKSARLNGKPLDRLYLTHGELLRGGVLEFVMSAAPNKKSASYAKPYSLTR
ncbi:MAG: GH92 family glycosyl hydrolase [Bacteroidales bacterium]|nr:GH92 family glycosyl hydrolase [Bacteroidales bacterium]